MPRARRTPLNKERVLRAAIAFADEQGVDALSMRKLGRRLGVEAMSLYNYVASKDELLDGIVEAVAGEIDLALDEADWKAGMRRRVLSANELFGRHPWAAALWMTSRTLSPARLRYSDAVLRGLREAGFSDDLTYHAFHVLQSHLLGFALHEQSLGFEQGELRELAARFLSTFPVAEYPDVAEHVRQHLEPHEGHQGTFAFGLELILGGLERLRDAARS